MISRIIVIVRRLNRINVFTRYVNNMMLSGMEIVRGLNDWYLKNKKTSLNSVWPAKFRRNITSGRCDCNAATVNQQRWQYPTTTTTTTTAIITDIGLKHTYVYYLRTFVELIYGARNESEHQSIRRKGDGTEIKFQNRMHTRGIAFPAETIFGHFGTRE